MGFKPFDEKEIDIQKFRPNRMNPKAIPVINTAITRKENAQRIFNNETPCWIPYDTDFQNFRPRIFPDNVVNGSIVDAEPKLTVNQFGGYGWFNTHWVYVPEVGGATTVPGEAQLADVNDWEKLEWPDLSTYDFARSAEVNKDFFDRSMPIYVHMPCGYWERMMALMEVTDAALALIDEDQKEAIHAFFTKLTDLYIEVVDKTYEAYHPDMYMWHDDWGTNQSYFFSTATLDEMIIPHLKRLIDHIHSKGMLFQLHSCGHNENNVPFMIKAGVDMWGGQPLNDCRKIAEKYSKDILIGVYPPDYTVDTPDDEVWRLSQEFFETYKDLRVFITDRRLPDARFAINVYKLSRNYYK